MHICQKTSNIIALDAQYDIFKNEVSNLMKCPVCLENRSRSVATKGFRFRPDQECKKCGSIWRPPCPKWAAILCCILSIPLVLIGIGGGITYTIITLQESGLRTDEQIGSTAFAIGLTAIGVGALRYGVRVLRGRTGALEILKKGSNSP